MPENDDRKRLKVAIVGAGRMASVHLQALRSLQTPHEVAAVVDLRRGAAEELATQSQAKAFQSVRSMLEEIRPDVVHIVTPAGTHVEPAEMALTSGADVYVEKPFTETLAEAQHLIQVAAARRARICAGHQLIRQRSYVAALESTKRMGTLHLADSIFCFRSPTLRLNRAGPSSSSAQLLDVLPHPLYTLVHALQHLDSDGSDVSIKSLHTSATEIILSLQHGVAAGRLYISLRARPVRSSLTLYAARGGSECDFVHGVSIGSSNAGSGPLEKIFNPMREGVQRVIRTAGAVGRRFSQRGSYPGLVEILDGFYSGAVDGGHSPTSPEHLLAVTRVYEEVARNLRKGLPQVASKGRPQHDSPRVVLTGARGFLGREIARSLVQHGASVRGISRGIDPDITAVDDWVQADMSDGVNPDSLAGSTCVIHAAAETSGGVEEHKRNSILATQNLIEAMTQAGVKRLIHVSSVSVLSVPRWFETQSEQTPIADPSLPLGPYTWGKAESERLVADAARDAGIQVHIVRPGALVDWEDPAIPGQMGRQLYGKWHLGLGRPGLPIGVIGVDDCARAIAWMALEPESAPPIINLNDDELLNRGDVIRHMRKLGWHGRMIWVPISVVSAGFSLARWLLAIRNLRRPTPMKPFSILRHRNFDRVVSKDVLGKSRDYERSDYPSYLN